MGKLKRSTAIKTQQKKKSKSKLSVEELLDHAEDFLDQYELEKAFQCAKKALDIDPKNLHALDTMASIQMEMGNVESAKSLYEKLVGLSPDDGFSKYMCLAQLSSGIEAVNFYKKGVELMLIEFNKQSGDTNQPSTSKQDEDNDTNSVTKLDISTAFCSIAELYLTDLCMEEDAENLCKFYLDKSIEYDCTNPETLQLLASYWLSKDEMDQAKKFILDSVENWLPKYLEACECGPLTDPSQAITLSYDSRINTARILTEVEEYDKAVTVLEQLVEEDDEVIYIWYMLGWVNYCKGEDYYSNAKFYLKKADEMISKIKFEQRYLDDALKAHVKELLEKLVNVASDDEADGDKENLNENDDDAYETDEDEQVQDVMDLNANLKVTKDSFKDNKDQNNNVEESMELT
ncbi:putative assembly chaperone of rpl4 [Brachionus plicatilis]|uniref:Putative assembly chaperone of rpl4 n=1 Tax=Brachionus plicatilis TaxID=10195 RepID=A0A3M7SK94_BRAPC|nr:putative assembly chaperone of rpl4 [Brachionus plicatilis]